MQALLSERQLTWSTLTKIQSYFGGHFKVKQGLRCGRNTQTAPLLSIIRDPGKYDTITHADVVKAMMCYMSVSLATSTSNTVHILWKGKTTLRTFETR